FCALALVVPFALGVDVVGHLRFWAALAFLAFLQLMASILNFLPIPGIDGGNAIEPWLSPQWQRGFRQVAPFGMLLLFVFLWTPQFGGPFFGFVLAVARVLGLDQNLIAAGHSLFQFWRSCPCPGRPPP